MISMSPERLTEILEETATEPEEDDLYDVWFRRPDGVVEVQQVRGHWDISVGEDGTPKSKFVGSRPSTTFNLESGPYAEAGVGLSLGGMPVWTYKGSLRMGPKDTLTLWH